MPPAQESLTQLLIECSHGRREAMDRLIPLVYQELHQMAGRYLRRESVGHTLQTTALIHEVYLRLIDQNSVTWQNRAHFFGVAAQMMRRILVDHARSRHAAKRGGSAQKVTLSEAAGLPGEQDLNVIALDEAMKALAVIDSQQCRIVELRYFGGLSIEETAEVLGISPATVKRDWNLARAWLYREIRKE